MKKNKQKFTVEHFALNVSALSTYTDEISMELGKEVIQQADTISKDLVSIKYGAKGNKVGLPLIKNTIYLTPAGAGQFTSSGTTTIAEPQITMYAVSTMEGIYPKTLKEYFYDMYMGNSYNNVEDLGKYTDIFVQSKTEAAGKEIGKAIWRGAKTAPAYATVTGNLTSNDGFLQVAYANSASTINFAKSAITESNALNIINWIWSGAVNSASVLLNGSRAYVSPVDFQNIVTNISNEYKYNLNMMDIENLNEIKHPTKIGLTIVKVNDLDGVASGTMIITPKENIWAVISDESDLDYKIWYSPDFREYRFEGNVKIGTGFYQPELVVNVR
jgi:hypothetical protein